MMFLVGLALVIQGLINTRNFRDELTRIIQLQTNRQVVIRGNVSVSLLPVPTLYVPGVELRDARNENSQEPTATVGMIRIQVSLLSVLTQQPRITAVSLDRPVLELVRAEDQLIHWGWINSSLVKALANENSPGNAVALDISNGRILCRDAATEKTVTIDNVNFNASNGSSLAVAGAFSTFGHNMNFTFSSGNAADPATGDMPFSFAMTSTDKSSMNLEGSMNLTGDLPVVKGSMKLELEDAATWVQALEENQSGLLDTVTNRQDKETEEEAKFPLKLAGEWKQEGLTVDIVNLQLEGMNSAGIGDLSLKWNDWRPVLLTSMHFSAMNYDVWSAFVRLALIPETDVIRQVYREDGNTLLPKDFNLTVNVKADEVYVGNQSWRNTLVSASMADGSITVNQFSIDLPGESSLTLFGVISPAATGDLRFEGSMETQGKSLRNMLTVLDGSAADLPELGFGSFFAHSNVFLSSEQLRLSEADVKLGELRLNGGMVFYFDAQPRVEADVKLKNINFDYFRDAWRERESKNIDKGKDFFLKYDKSMNFNWLRKLTTTIDFRVSVDRFTFLEHPGTNASFRIYARYGDFGIYDINFIYPTDIMRGTFRLNVNGEKPLLNLSFSASEINTDYFSYENTFMTEEDKKKKQEEDERKANEAIAQKEKEKREEELKKQQAEQPVAIAEDPTAPITEPIAPTPSPADALRAIDAKGKPLTAIAMPEQTGATPVASEVNTPAPQAMPATPPAPNTQPTPDGGTLTIQPQSERYVQLAQATEAQPPRAASSLDDLLKRGEPRTKIDTAIGGGKLTELLDMGWMNGVQGVIDLNVAKLVHKNVTLGNFRLQANLANDLLNFKTLTFNYWGGQCSIAGSMYGGKVPGFSVSVAFLNGNLHDFLYDLTGRDNIQGGLSVSATLATSGVNYLSWIQQAEGKAVLVGRGVNVQGFNLKGVVDAVNISRTSSDVANSVNMVIGSGSTMFSVDGNVNIKNGLLRTPGMNLRTENIMGSFTGEVRMLKWEMDLTTMFQFPEMSSETIPTMTVQLSGPLDKGELRTDTSSLEAYVAKRIISK
ncbi:MAG: AsmA family protein [Rickettsiales bacterium]|nr:AsmA family protein [Rickettsiales bacterium]